MIRKYLPILVNLGLILAIVALAWIYGPSLLVEGRFRHQQRQQQQQQEPTGEAVAISQPLVGFSSLISSVTGFGELIEEEVKLDPLSVEFGLVIPKIFVNVSVAENVNPADAQVYQKVLKQAGGVAHAAGSAVPGEPGTVYIFGHSTDTSLNLARFNAMFYLLRKLEPGDEIWAYYQGQEYVYQVTAKKIVEPTDISDIVNVENEERLVLQTCWPPGTDWRRLLIIAKPKLV